MTNLGGWAEVLKATSVWKMEIRPDIKKCARNHAAKTGRANRRHGKFLAAVDWDWTLARCGASAGQLNVCVRTLPRYLCLVSEYLR